MPGRSIEQTMIVSNGGSGSLDWSASKTAGWLNLSAESGTSGLSVTVSENLTGLNPGTYTDNITITAAGAINSPLVVPVTLTVTAGGGSTFVYDGDGKRVKKTENGQTIVYVNKYFESNLTASENTTYYYLGGRLTAMRKGESLRYVHQDHLTGTSLMTDTSGAQVGTTMKYYPFGGTRSGAVPTDIRFTGQRLDESGLYYFNARYYDPQIGRFISADPFVQWSTGINVVSSPFTINMSIGSILTSSLPVVSATLNRYTYCLNNPVRFSDPTGWWTGFVGLGGSGGCVWGGTGSIGFAFDGHGNVALVANAGAGSFIGLGASGGITAEGTSADSINDTVGTCSTVQMGGGGGAPLSVDVEGVVGRGQNGQAYGGLSVTVGFAPAKVSFHTFMTSSWELVSINKAEYDTPILPSKPGMPNDPWDLLNPQNNPRGDSSSTTSVNGSANTEFTGYTVVNVSGPGGGCACIFQFTNGQITSYVACAIAPTPAEIAAGLPGYVPQ